MDQVWDTCRSGANDGAGLCRRQHLAVSACACGLGDGFGSLTCPPLRRHPVENSQQAPAGPLQVCAGSRHRRRRSRACGAAAASAAAADLDVRVGRHGPPHGRRDTAATHNATTGAFADALPACATALAASTACASATRSGAVFPAATVDIALSIFTAHTIRCIDDNTGPAIFAAHTIRCIDDNTGTAIFAAHTIGCIDGNTAGPAAGGSCIGLGSGDSRACIVCVGCDERSALLGGSDSCAAGGGLQGRRGVVGWQPEPAWPRARGSPLTNRNFKAAACWLPAIPKLHSADQPPFSSQKGLLAQRHPPGGVPMTLQMW
eukprot:356269-Chlamydomonas_euryale.AAC.2